MMSDSRSLQELRRELRASIGNRDRLAVLNSRVTALINHKDTYGEEKTALQRFRQEVREVLSCRTE